MRDKLAPQHAEHASQSTRGDSLDLTIVERGAVEPHVGHASGSQRSASVIGLGISLSSGSAIINFWKLRTGDLAVLGPHLRSWLPPNLAYAHVEPPSTRMTWPVTNDDISEARKTAASATSVGRASRLNAVRSTMSAPALRSISPAMSVSVSPGAIALTRMPWAPSSA